MMQEPSEAIVPLGASVIQKPEQGNGVGVLLIHGFSGSPYQMRDLGQLLLQHGYTISIPRLPGHATNPDYFARSKTEDWQACVEEAFQSLREQELSVVVIGRSFGGVLALDLALQHPNDVLGCIGIGTPAPLSSQVWLRRIFPLVRLVRKSVKKPWAKPEEREARLQQGRYLELPLAAVSQYLRLLVTMTPQRLAELKIPVLFIHGTSDTAASPASLAYYNRFIGSTRKEMVLLDTVGHDAEQLHGHPQVREKVLQFLVDCTKS